MYIVFGDILQNTCTGTLATVIRGKAFSDICERENIQYHCIIFMTKNILSVYLPLKMP